MSNSFKELLKRGSDGGGWQPGPRDTALDSDPFSWLNDLPFNEYSVEGEPRKFYSIGTVCRALAIKPVTLRSWEQKGWMVKPKYRTPPPKGKQVQGSAKGRRLYTEAQLRFLVEAYGKYVGEQKDWEAFRKALASKYPTR